MHLGGDYSKSYVSRADLEAFARKRNRFPAFLFDTLSPFSDIKSTPIQPSVTVANFITQKPNPHPEELPNNAKNKGGRPTEYDWDSFMLEIIHRANQPDGLPDKQAELVREMLEWFNIRFGSEPAESSIKARISKIYKYLEEAKNPSP